MFAISCYSVRFSTRSPVLSFSFPFYLLCLPISIPLHKSLTCWQKLNIFFIIFVQLIILVLNESRRSSISRIFGHILRLKCDSLRLVWIRFLFFFLIPSQECEILKRRNRDHSMLWIHLTKGSSEQNSTNACVSIKIHFICSMIRSSEPNWKISSVVVLLLKLAETF